MNKSNKFIDRRIGEKDRTMTAEDRLMARFITQQRKSHNKVTQIILEPLELLIKMIHAFINIVDVL